MMASDFFPEYRGYAFPILHIDQYRQVALAERLPECSEAFSWHEFACGSTQDEIKVTAGVAIGAESAAIHPNVRLGCVV